MKYLRILIGIIEIGFAIAIWTGYYNPTVMSIGLIYFCYGMVLILINFNSPK